VISRYDAPNGCAATATVVDGQALAALGSHALYATADGFQVVGAYPAVRRPFMPPAHHP
jgi:hypothetical protein